jgi:RimJ/RimL family protein N-acetyltransferase
MILPPFLRGPRLALRALCAADADGPYLTWLNDAEVCLGNSHHRFPYTRASALEYIDAAAGSTQDLVLAIVLVEDQRHIGNIALTHIHPIYRSAELALLVGDIACWGQGYGTEAARLICSHGFAALNLHRIYCGTFATNTAMIRLATTLGMRQEGVRRQAAFKAGAYVDVVEFGMLRDEYVGAPPPRFPKEGNHDIGVLR